MSNAAIKQLTDAEQKMLVQAENTSDSILRNINYFITDTFENNKTIQDALSKPYSPLLSLQITNAISTIQNSFDAIDKVYLFNLSNDIIYTGDAPVYSSADFPDKELLSYIKSAHKYTVNKPLILKFEDEYTTNKIVEKRMLASIYKLDNNRAMAVFIDSDSFNSFVNTPLTHTSQYMTILNSDGIVISSTDESLFGTDLSEDKVYRKLLSQTAQSGTLKYRGKVYFYRTAQTMNTFYISEIPRSDIISSFAVQFIFILLFGCILIFLLFISSIMLSASIYRPFKNLRQSIGNILNIDDSNAETGTDEDLKNISKNLSDIKSKYDAMQTTEMLYTNSKRNELVYNIINGSYNFDSDTLAEYNIYFPYPYTTVLLFRLDNTKKINQSDIGLIQYGIANVATEIMTNHEMLSYSTSFGGEYDITFIANHKSAHFNTEAITHIQKYINNIFSVTATVSYDTAEHDIDNISQAYRNAEYSMQYRLIKGHNSIISYSSLRDAIKTSDAAYPQDLEKEIINAVRAKNEDAVITASKAFIEYLSVLPYMYITVYSCILIMTIDMYKTNSSDNDIDTVADDLTKIETIDALLPIIQTKCSSAMAEDDSSSGSKYDVIANNIEKYIDENYTDPNLSIHVIASYVNKSANYTRNIFKQVKGISISDYITKKRFGEVCRLLIETNLTAQTISQQTGMSSGSYFYTAFKKYTGYTPEQFRKKYMGTDFNPDKL
jgi:AraC-like DNA-binding protein